MALVDQVEAGIKVTSTPLISESKVVELVDA